MQRIPPTMANQQTQAQKKRGSRARKLLGANAEGYRLKPFLFEFAVKGLCCWLEACSLEWSHIVNLLYWYRAPPIQADINIRVPSWGAGVVMPRVSWREYNCTTTYNVCIISHYVHYYDSTVLRV